MAEVKQMKSEIGIAGLTGGIFIVDSLQPLETINLNRVQTASGLLFKLLSTYLASDISSNLLDQVPTTWTARLVIFEHNLTLLADS